MILTVISGTHTVDSERTASLISKIRYIIIAIAHGIAILINVAFDMDKRTRPNFLSISN